MKTQMTRESVAELIRLAEIGTARDAEMRVGSTEHLEQFEIERDGILAERRWRLAVCFYLATRKERRRHYGEDN